MGTLSEVRGERGEMVVRAKSSSDAGILCGSSKNVFDAIMILRRKVEVQLLGKRIGLCKRYISFSGGAPKSTSPTKTQYCGPKKEQRESVISRAQYEYKVLSRT